ncbi:MAG TPA: MmcQ/YjbR family DNA-binding protein [Rugosimonospora sp.]|jgi:hypothetical protein
MVTLDQVATMALALPETTEVPAWEGERTWRTRNKIFVMGSPESPSITVKTSAEEQTELIAADPDTYAYAAYVGRFGWTRIQRSSVDADELRELIIEAWRRTATKAVVRRYDAGHADDSA